MKAAIDSTQIVIKQLNQLKELVSNYQDAASLNKNLQLVVGIAIVTLTILGQLIIFRLTRKKELALFKINREKEITIKVAELYGKYKSLALHYLFASNKYSDIRLRLPLCKLAIQHYELEQVFTEEDHKKNITTLNKLKDILKNLTELNKARIKEYDTTRIQVVELLNQIHFYYKDDALKNLITKFNKIYIPTFSITEFKPEMTSDSYILQYREDNYDPIKIKLKEVLRDLGNRILDLSE